ncbi:MAG: PAS domain S-box protein [Methylophilus sp.]|uniref:PAS domain S-box protein n=1 Tax=Methylophilus sp. TaxID=29541 RepID=UPI003FA057D4
MTSHEKLRLAKLRSLGLLDSDPDEFFDCITRVASTILGTPISVISLVDENRQWFKSRHGIEATETARDISFCTHAVSSGKELIVEDASNDERFASNPLVVNAPNIRFYAGIPIKSVEGYSLGTLCVIDNKPKRPSVSELKALNDLAQLATKEIQFRERMLSAQDSIDLAKSKFKSVFESAGVGIALVNPVGSWLQVNDELCKIVDYTQTELLDLTFQDITHPEDLNTDLNLLDQLVAGKIDRYQLEKRYIRKDKNIIWVEITITKHTSENGELDYFIAIVKDIQAAKETEFALTALRKTLEEKVAQRTDELHRVNQSLSKAYQEKINSEQELQNKELELRTILDNANEAYICMDAEGLVTAWNKQAEHTFGWLEHEAIGKKLEKLIIPTESQDAHHHGMHRYLTEKKSRIAGTRIELEAVRKDGIRIPIELQVNALEINKQILFTSFLRDITERKQLENLLKNEARNDPLTGLANRRKLEEILPIAFQRARTNHVYLALVFIDLDGFKLINDTHGHQAGDQLLKEVANRIKHCSRLSDTAVRYAGDEFVIVLENLKTKDDTNRISDNIQKIMAEPVMVGETQLHITLSIGIAYYGGPDPQSIEPLELIRLADKAMYTAKKNGKNGVVIID